ncbi:MAG: ABC transporter permease [Chloroflexi bacterium]|nr:ABC transporter permease [Chloroflexota bacterium]
MAAVNEQLGLDRPLPEQFGRWVVSLARGDLGFSYFFRRPAFDVVSERLAATVLLGGSAWLLSSAIGIAGGVWAARHHGTWVDRLLSSGAIVLLATPSFWLGILLIVVFRRGCICCRRPEWRRSVTRQMLHSALATSLCLC